MCPPCLCADPSAWQPAVGPQGAPAAAAQVLARLASRGRLFETLSRLLLTACPVLSPIQAAGPMSLAEALISNLAVRFVSLQQQARIASLASTVPKLLCAPLLWGRCPHVLLTVGAQAYFCVNVTAGALLCLTEVHNSMMCTERTSSWLASNSWLQKPELCTAMLYRCQVECGARQSPPFLP